MLRAFRKSEPVEEGDRVELLDGAQVVAQGTVWATFEDSGVSKDREYSWRGTLRRDDGGAGEEQGRPIYDPLYLGGCGQRIYKGTNGTWFTQEGGTLRKIAGRALVPNTPLFRDKNSPQVVVKIGCLELPLLRVPAIVKAMQEVLKANPPKEVTITLLGSTPVTVDEVRVFVEWFTRFKALADLALSA